MEATVVELGVCDWSRALNLEDLALGRPDARADA